MIEIEDQEKELIELRDRLEAKTKEMSESLKRFQKMLEEL